jgi:hypothetical protein
MSAMINNHTSNKECFCRLGILKTITTLAAEQCCSKTQHDPELMVACMENLACACDGHIGCQDAFRESDGIEATCDCLLLHKFETSWSWCALVLGNCANKHAKNKSLVRIRGGLSLLVKNLLDSLEPAASQGQSGGGLETLKDATISALSVLSRVDLKNKTAIAKEGGVTVLTMLAGLDHSKCAPTKNFALLFLMKDYLGDKRNPEGSAFLGKSPATREQYIQQFFDANGCLHILDTLLDSAANACLAEDEPFYQTVQFSAKLLQKLSEVEIGRKKLTEPKVAECIVLLLLSCPKFIKKDIIDCLGNCARGDTNARHFMSDKGMKTKI